VDQLKRRLGERLDAFPATARRLRFPSDFARCGLLRLVAGRISQAVVRQRCHERDLPGDLAVELFDVFDLVLHGLSKHNGRLILRCLRPYFHAVREPRPLVDKRL
jgi:hypothetical protein